MPAPDVAALLAELERSEPDYVEDARTAVEWLTGGEPLETVTQLDVCEFLWYTLPIKVSGDERAHKAVAAALSRLLTLGGLDRYAAMCRSHTTANILHAYARSGEEAGIAAYRAALDATGVLPPDVADLRWSSIMGPEELGAHLACSAALELAIVSGALEVGSPSWKAHREALTRRWLTEPRAELGGDNWLHRVHGERLNRWVLGRGAARRELAQPFEVRLHAPVPLPPGEHLAPLRWLLDRAAEPGGLTLTRRHNLSRALSVEAAQAFGWAAGGSPRGEADVPPLSALREAATGEMGALRRTGRRLLLTAEGTELMGDPGRMWDAVAAALLAPAEGERDFEVSAREAALLILADGATVTVTGLRERVAEVVTGEGWRSATAPATATARGDELDVPLTGLLRRLTAFGLGPVMELDAEEPSIRLTANGRAAALAALRAHALRPRKYVSLGVITRPRG
ncbi:hypothetical protein Misp01_78480 [Microtetraspora sp. NBRC 13810]|uniref:hypothetical protein n=1 Tax=Microtetraspora sp. NBRC 13810 TaxID=3030990 RepID=UPI0024A22759|nr:hypothetical protein [Microtetraspora sp. NBRC 13810]GLW12720.1 hypothetical protein Misp01_78480 [Microtetraspora sp. NBRC 13810]